MVITMREKLTEKKREDAMRIFEALSHVDAELLARSEEPVGRNSVRKRPIWYYGSAVAACLCLLVCGAALLNGRSMLLKNKASKTDCAVNMDSIEQKMPVDTGAAESVTGVAESVADASECEGAVPEMPESSVDMTDLGKLSSKQQSGSAVVEACLKYNGEEITLQEARSVEAFGEYIPDNLPVGYTLESVYREKNGETGITESLSLCWTRGMDSIFWTITMTDTVSISTVDISKPETYDVHLYEIPYADTVPEAYRDSFDNPVFAEADFSLDMVEARMKVISDAGDTDTPRGNFSVLYENGILVKFNGRGDAEQIYSMFPQMR